MKFERAAEIVIEKGGRLITEQELVELVGELPYKVTACACGGGSNGGIGTAYYVPLVGDAVVLAKRADREPFGGVVPGRVPYTAVFSCINCGHSKPIMSLVSERALARIQKEVAAIQPDDGKLAIVALRKEHPAFDTLISQMEGQDKPGSSELIVPGAIDDTLAGYSPPY